jgi:hypothetical protein
MAAEMNLRKEVTDLTNGKGSAVAIHVKQPRSNKSLHWTVWRANPTIGIDCYRVDMATINQLARLLESVSSDPLLRWILRRPRADYNSVLDAAVSEKPPNCPFFRTDSMALGVFLFAST